MRAGRFILGGAREGSGDRALELHVGLDVSLESTSVCIVDETGKKVLEASVASDPEAMSRSRPLTKFLDAGRYFYSCHFYRRRTLRSFRSTESHPQTQSLLQALEPGISSAPRNNLIRCEYICQGGLTDSPEMCPI